MKYDFKALNRYLIVIHLMLLVTAALGRFVFIGRAVKNPNALSDAGAVIMMIGILIYIILFMTAVFGTLLMIAIHFYKNLYSDEGYLTHTLPVTRGQLLLSKTVSGSIWSLIDMALVIISILILVLYEPIVREFAAQGDDVLTVFGFPETVGYGKILFALFLMFVVSAITNVLTIYVSIAVGQLFSNHRVLGAVIVYFGINTIISIIGGACGAAYMVAIQMPAADESMMYLFYSKTFVFTMILQIVTAVVFYVVTYLLMQKKLNLN